MRIAFFGTPPFAADLLKHLLDAGVEVVAVISKPDRPQGRSQQSKPVAVKKIAEEYCLPIYQPEKVSALEFLPTLQAFQADLFVVVAYGEILRQHVLDVPKVACINLHASLLPKYRGAAPIQRAIMSGEKESGVTVMHMVKKMDAGDIILQLKTAIGLDMTYGELEQVLLNLGSSALIATLKQFEGGHVCSTPQNELEASFASKIELEECQIDWKKKAVEIHNLVRGVNPEPGAWCFLNLNQEVKRLKVFKTKPHLEILISPGAIAFDSARRFIVGTGEGAIELLEVQLEGKKRMGALDFYRGLPKNNSLSLVLRENELH